MIALVHINYSQDHSEKILPFGILSVGSALKKSDYEAILININEKQIDDTVKKIIEMNPDYIGISVMTGIQTQHSAEFSKKIKNKSKIPVLWGGIHPSLLPEQCIKEDYVDYVICGEGELTILEFTDKLLSGRNLNSVLGLAYKENGKIFINPPRPLIDNLDEWRLDFSLLDLNQFIFPLGKYKRTIAYKTSRGCPFGCAFCYNFIFNKSRWRAWSEDVVLSDINYLKSKYKIDSIKFYDDNFFVDIKRALSLLKAINLPAHVEIRIDFINEEMASELKKLRVFDMLIGIESGSDRLLTLIDKRFTVEKLLKGVEIIAKYGLHASYSFIVGLPTETKEEFESTIKLMHQIYTIHPQAGFTLGAYLPYPGSKLYNFSLSQGFNTPDKTEDWGRIDRFRKDFNSPWVNVKKVWVIRECFKILSWDLKFLKKWFEFRIRHRFYSYPLDIYLVEFLAGTAIEERGIFGKILRKTYNFFRFKNTEHGKLLSGIIYPEFFPISKNDSVLNIGCGDGIQAIVYRGNFKKMTGIDINQNRLKIARELTVVHGINNFETLCANVEEIPLNDKFDKVIAIDIIEHVINPDKVLSEVWRLLKDDGKLLITFPVMHDKWENFFRFVGRKILRRKGKTIRKEGWDPDAHQYDFKLKEWFNMMDKKDFSLVDYRATTMFPPLHYLGLPKFWFSNKIIHAIDNYFCKLPIFKNHGQAAVCILKKTTNQ